MRPVEVSATTLLFPSYPLGRPDREPPLHPEFAPRGQPIYPYPTIESYARTPVTRSLRAVIVENEFLRLTFLPELNARLWSIWDKLAHCEVLYANPELKPGLVGLRGCWYATGIEVNFPCSHTITTTDEIAHEVFLDDAGAAHFVAWDVEAVSGMSWQCITTLAPGSAAVGMETRLANPTDLPHRWFFWVNAAYPIHEGTRFVLPPSTRRIFNEGGGAHGLAGYLRYPDNHDEDIGLLSNLKQHSAFFAVAPDEGFFGLHHPQSDTGIAHVADPSLVNGRKLWSWGCAPDGLVWRDVLTDTGGQYCEVQSGPLPSQLEYRMLAPGQVMVQRDTWLPLRGLGGLSHATADAALSWELVSGAVRFNVLTAAEQPGATIRLEGPQAMEYVLDLGPRATPVELRLLSPEEHRLTLLDADGLPLVESVPLSPPVSREPNRIRAARPATAFQRARWHEWCGARRAAEKLYREAGEEEAGAAAALARFALERGDAASATRWATRAQALDWHLPEANLAAALAARLDSRRHDALWQWERCLSYPETRRSGQLGLIDDALAEGLFRRAEERCGHLLAETDDLRVYGRLAHARRRLGRPLALAALAELPNARLDPLLAAERRLADAAAPPLNGTAKLAAAALLAALGDPEAALRVLDDQPAPSPGTPPALLDYARAWIADKLPDPAAWDEGFAHGAAAVAVLRFAMDADPDDLTAAFHLGCALAAGGDWAGAETCWAAATDGPWGAEANRCMGLAAWHLHEDLAAAEAFFRHAVASGGGARTLLEQDHLLARLGRHEERISILRAALNALAEDTRVPLRLAAALLDAGRPEETLALLVEASFQLYEGGTLPQVLWHRSHRVLAERALAAGDQAAAARHYREATRHPEHLGVGAPAENHLCETWYRCAAAHQSAGEAEAAAEAFAAGAEQGYELVQETFAFNELLPEHAPPRLGTGWARNQLYRALCLRESGRTAEAGALLGRIEALAGELGCDERVPAAIQAVRRGEEPEL